MRAGEVAARAGVNVETLRYYERRGLLPEPQREPSGHRSYDEETLHLLHAIKEAQAVGFTLGEIAEYLRAARRSGSPSRALRVRMAAKIDEIDSRIAGLRRMRDELARVVGCACASLDHCTCGAAQLARGGREPSTRPLLLHVTNGESAGNTLRRTRIGGAVLPWQDALHEGPVPAVARAELLRVRARLLASCGWGERVRDPRVARAARPHVRRRARRRPPRRALVRARPVRPAPAVRRARPRPRGGRRAGADRRRRLPGSRAFRRSRRADRGRAGDALAGPARGDGRGARGRGGRVAGVHCARADGSGRAGHAAAVRRGGCSTAARGAARDARRPVGDGAARAAGDRRRRAHTGVRLRRRAAARGGAVPRRHVVLPAARRAVGARRDGRRRSAPAAAARRRPALRRRADPADGRGERVLAGELDRVELLGVDRWIGGTHVTGDAMWRWDGRRGVLVAPA